MNKSTIIGIILGILLLTAAIADQTGGSKFFINIPGIFIVLGGTAAATFISFPMTTVLQVFKSFTIVFRREPPKLESYIDPIVDLASKARGGFLALEKEKSRIRDLFLRDAIEMLVDGYPAEEIRNILEQRIFYRNAREKAEADVFRVMAKFAPAFGMIGTLIGLIMLLANMNVGSLDRIGGNMAVALVTTFYGLLLANLVFKPISVKLERRAEERTLLMKMLTDSMTMIRDGWPTYRIQDYLNSYIPPGKRTTPVREKERGQTPEPRSARDVT